MHSLFVWLGCALLGAALTGAFMLRRAMKRMTPPGMTMREFADKTNVSGYLSPPPNEHGIRFLRRLSKALIFLQLGEVKVIGRENLAFSEPYVVTPNHGSSVDPPIFPTIWDKPFRYMAARGVFNAFGGWFGVIAGGTGCFAADLDVGKGGGARKAAVEVLCSGQNVVMFPEGWAWLDGAVRPFKKGAVRIVKEAAQRLGKPVYLMPSYIRYGRYPGTWILRYPPQVQYLLLFLMLPIYRRGATVVIGKPISSADLPADDEVATDFLRESVLALDPAR